jgi:transmembrane sensor
MSTHDHSRTDEALDESAAAWLCEREEGFTPERAHAFAAWRDRDPRHEAAVARVECTLALLGEMPVVRAPLEARFGRTGETPAAPARVAAASRSIIQLRIRQWAAGLAAALALGSAVWWTAELRAPAGERYATEAAAQRRVALQDGTVVDINAASDVHVQFTERERRVALTAGEAHFEVAPDAARPFVVTAAGVSVRAVGTAFNVRLAAGAIDVLVVEGKVEVARGPTKSRAAAAAPSLLTAGERARVSRDAAPRVEVEKVAPELVRAMLAWQDPLTTFRDVPLREIVARLNLRNPTQLVVDDAELSERKIGGVIALDQVEAFVRLLEQGGDVVSERRGGGEIVLRRAR